MTTAITDTVRVTIDAPLADVTSFLATAENHPLWGTEFFTGEAEQINPAAFPGEVRVTVPAMGGKARMYVVADNANGIIDLYLAPGDAPYGDPLPVRVIRNGTGSDVLFTLARMPGQPDAAWEEGVAAMQRELEKLKALLEKDPSHALAAS